MAFSSVSPAGFGSGFLRSAFNAEANPYAPPYDPAFWNDPEGCPGDSFQHFVESYEDIIDVLSNRHPDRLGDERSIEISKLLDVLKVYLMLNPRTFSEITGLSMERISSLRTAYQETFGHVQWRTNCYAHAVNFPGTGRLPGFRLVPGGLRKQRNFLKGDSPEDFLKKTSGA